MIFGQFLTFAFDSDSRYFLGRSFYNQFSPFKLRVRVERTFKSSLASCYAGFPFLPEVGAD